MVEDVVSVESIPEEKEQTWGLGGVALMLIISFAVGVTCTATVLLIRKKKLVQAAA